MDFVEHVLILMFLFDQIAKLRKGYLNVIWPLGIGVVGKVGISVVIGLFLILFLRSLTLFVVELLFISMLALACLIYKYKTGPVWYQSRNPPS